jgi:hypothetical protein
MAKNLYTPEQIVSILRRDEVAVANGKPTPQAYEEAEIVEQTLPYYSSEWGPCANECNPAERHSEKRSLFLQKRRVSDVQ